MKDTHLTRITAVILTVLLLFSAVPLTAAAHADSKTDVQTAVLPALLDNTGTALPAAQIVLSEKSGILTLSLQLKGTGLSRTQCLSLSYDPAELTLLQNDNTAVSAPASMTVCNAASFVTAAQGWSSGLLRTVSGKEIPTMEHGRAGTDRGLLLLYPTADSPQTYTAFRTVLTIRFALSAQTAPGSSSIRLFSYAEQEVAAQSVKLLLCTEGDYYTYGSRSGGDTLAAPAFTGHAVITGSMDEESTTPSTSWRNPFVDISESLLYYDAIAYVAQNGLFVGDEQDRFLPDASMNRATFATVLCRLAGEEAAALAAPAGTSAFTDVKANDWFAPYVRWAVDNSIFLGYGDGRFGPEDAITHEQMYLLIQRFTESRDYNVRDGSGVSLSSLSDADKISKWENDAAVNAVRFAFANGLLIADANRSIRPTEAALRWELAVLLQSLSEIERTGSGSAVITPVRTGIEIPDCPPASDALVKGAVQTIYNGLLTLTEKINIASFHLNYEQFGEAYNEAAKQPEFFYVDNLYYFTYSQMTGEILTVTPTYTMRGTELREAQKQYTEKLNELLSGVDAGWSDLEKILYLHDTMAVRFVYDETLGTFDALSLLTGKRGVCQAYTLVMQAALNALGIENSRVLSIDMNHTWNLVRLNGSWYHLDVTWDDPQPDQHGQVQHLYFLKSDAYMTQNKHYSWTCFDGITCTDTTYDSTFFTDVRTPFVPGSDGAWYYISNTSGAVFRWNPASNTRSRVCTTGIRWTTSEGVYQSMYTGLVRIDNILLYNSADAILAYHIDTGITETIHKTTAAGYICGLTLEWSSDSAGNLVPYLIYQVRSSPSSTSGTLFRVSAANLFTYSVTGLLRGYFADATTKVSLLRNGTTYKVIILPRTDSFLETEQTFSLDGIKPGRYDLVVEKKGCLTYTVKSIDIHAYTDLQASLGALTLLCGDINADGKINGTDLSQLLHQNTFRRTADRALTPAADCNGDGFIDIVDHAILTDADRFGYDKAVCTVTHAA